jgi:hypothetical protein
MNPSSGTNYVMLFVFIALVGLVVFGATAIAAGARRSGQRLAALEHEVFDHPE